MKKLIKEKLYEEEFIYFKGPSKEKVLKNLEGKTLKEKFEIALENKIDWLIEDCLEKGVENDYSLEDTFILGIKYNIPEIVERCIAIGIDVNKKQIRLYDYEPILFAVGTDKKEIVKVLLKDKNLDPTIDNNKALELCFSYPKNISILKLLINDKRVKKSLNDTEIRYYKSLIK
jgi:hypothetical protein